MKSHGNLKSNEIANVTEVHYRAGCLRSNKFVAGTRIKFADLGAYTTGDLLKRVISELPVPLIPKETFARLSEIKADNPKREEDTIALLQTLSRTQTATLEIILQLCKYVARTLLLLALTRHYRRVTMRRGTNKMDCNKLGLVMVPALMPYVTDVEAQSLTQSRDAVLKGNELFEYLVPEVESLFKWVRTSAPSSQHSLNLAAEQTSRKETEHEDQQIEVLQQTRYCPEHSQARSAHLSSRWWRHARPLRAHHSLAHCKEVVRR